MRLILWRWDTLIKCWTWYAGVQANANIKLWILCVIKPTHDQQRSFVSSACWVERWQCMSDTLWSTVYVAGPTFIQPCIMNTVSLIASIPAVCATGIFPNRPDQKIILMLDNRLIELNLRPINERSHLNLCFATASYNFKCGRVSGVSSENRRSRVRTPLRHSSFKETKCFFPAHS